MKITAALFLAHLSYDNILKVFKVNVQAGTETGRSVILKPGPGPTQNQEMLDQICPGDTDTIFTYFTADCY